MKLRYLALLLLLASCTIITSCAPTIKDLNKYQKQFLSKTEFMPTEDALANKAPKVVVFALDENENQVAVQAQLGNTIANNVENVLARDRLAELVDRKASAKLQKEISLAEMNKTGSYKGPKVADYAVSGTISNAGFTSKYSKGGVYYSPKTGWVSVPPSFKYSSDVAGNLKIYELPSLTVIETVEFSGKKTRTENVRQDGGVSLGGFQIGGKELEGAQRDDNLVRKAGEDAVDNIKVNIQNSFAKKGYILEKRIYDGKSIFKISIGSIDGVKHGDKFEISGQYESENAITNKSEIERRIIGDGTVTDKIDPKTCWVIVDDSKLADSVRLGDSIKMKYKRHWFAGMAKLASSFID